MEREKGQLLNKTLEETKGQHGLEVYDQTKLVSADIQQNKTVEILSCQERIM